MKKQIILAVSIVLLLVSCENTNSTLDETSTLVVKSGFVCGWGAGVDTLEISHDIIKYVYYVPSKSQKPQIEKSRAVTSAEWVEITNAVKMDEFMKLKYETCNVCADGCDEWISIKKNNDSHKITYTMGAKIDPISKLQQKIEQLRKEFNPK